MTDKKAMDVLGKAVYGCYLMTVKSGDMINGMPLSLFMQTGFDPPMVACGVSPKRRTHQMVKDAGSFAVVFLKKDQADLVDAFKIKGEDPGKKYDGVDWEEGETGAPLLKDCLGYVECRLVDSFSPGDHTMFIGEVVNSKLVSEGELLTIQDLDKHYSG